MRTKPENREARASTATAGDTVADERESLRTALRGGGLGPSIAESLAAALFERWSAANASEREALLEGAMLAARSAGAAAPVDRDLETDVREVERMLGAFASELEKMDEVLDVLAATVGRMRSVTAPADETVH